MVKTYTIYPLITLITDDNEMSMKTLGQNYGKRTKDPVVMWLIQGNGRNVLVDSGQCDAETASRLHHPAVQPPEMLPVNRLKEHGVTPADIDTVVLTHLHWDHCYNLEMFSRAKIYVQEKEVRYAINPLPCHYLAYEAPQLGMTPPWLPHVGRMNMVNGDFDVDEGLNVYFMPGHSPGMQCVAVNTSDGVYLIASDNIPLFYNWKGDGKQKHIPSAIHCDLPDYYASFERMERVADHVIPAHDIMLLDCKKFPAK